VLAFAPDGSTLASSGRGKAVAFWEVRTGKLVRELRGHTHPAHAVAFEPDKRTLVSGGDYRTMTLWDVGSGKLRGTLTTCPAGQGGGAPEDWAAFTPRQLLRRLAGADRLLARQTEMGLRTGERLKLRGSDLLKESIRGR
jgi:WD40 repeat protein